MMLTKEEACIFYNNLKNSKETIEKDLFTYSDYFSYHVNNINLFFWFIDSFLKNKITTISNDSISFEKTKFLNKEYKSILNKSGLSNALFIIKANMINEFIEKYKNNKLFTNDEIIEIFNNLRIKNVIKTQNKIIVELNK